jgi:hypothetical protein
MDDLRERVAVTTCEGCQAPLFENDDYISDPDGCSGCWATMTDAPSKRERPCYAHRVGKPDANERVEIGARPKEARAGLGGSDSPGNRP